MLNSRSLRAAVALVLLPAGLGLAACGESVSQVQKRPSPGATFYVAANGRDAWSGTRAEPNANNSDGPFRSLARCQRAMRDSASVNACTIRGGTYTVTATLNLTSADDGEAWQYYGKDGVNSAVLDGGGTPGGDDGVDIFLIDHGGSNITVNGLKMQNFLNNGAFISGAGASRGPHASHNVIENCDVGRDSTTSGHTHAGILVEDGPDTTIKNNYVHDVSSHGIAVYAYYAGESVVNSVIANNVILRNARLQPDNGGIYVSGHAGEVGGSPGTDGITVTNNFVRDYSAAGRADMHGIYLDDDASGVSVTGNVIGPPSEGTVGGGNNSEAPYLSHNGYNNTFSGNIVDLGDSTRVWTAVWYRDAGTGMSGSTFTGNIVISRFAGSQATNFTGKTGYSYFQNFGTDNHYLIANNIYHNYAGGPERTDGPIKSDRNPVHQDPLLSGWIYTLDANSPAYKAPVSFPPIAGGWGPPGFVIPQDGTPPSSLH